MAKKSTTTTKADATASQQDVMPTPDDDMDADAVASSADYDDGGDEKPSSKPEAPEVYDDPRARIAQRYRELRNEEEASDSEDQSDESEGDSDSKVDPVNAENDAEPVNEDENDPKRRSEPTSQATKIVVKIDGHEREMTIDEMTAIVQKHGAADNRLEEARSIRDDVKRLREELQAAQPRQPENQPGKSGHDAHEPDPSLPVSKAANQLPKGIDREKLKGIVERIQVGDTDEGIDATEELVALLSHGQPEIDSNLVNEIVQEQLFQRQNQEDIDGALRSFSEKYPEIVKNDVLSEAGMTVFKREIVRDLRDLGVSEEDIAPIRSNAKALSKAHQTLRRAGHKVRSYGEIFDGVGQYMTEAFGMAPSSETQPGKKPNPPATGPSNTVQSRQDRKRSMPTQPRAAGVREQAPKAPRPKTAQETIAEMRRQRNFSSLG